MTSTKADSVTSKEPVVRELAWAAGLIAVQSVGLLVAAGVLVLKTLTGHPDSVGRSLSGAVMAIAAVLVMLLCARGLRLAKVSSRTPMVVLELLALPVSYSLAFQSHLPAYGAPIMISALAVLYLLFTPAARLALEHDGETEAS